MTFIDFAMTWLMLLGAYRVVRRIVVIVYYFWRTRHDKGYPWFGGPRGAPNSIHG